MSASGSVYLEGGELGIFIAGEVSASGKVEIKGRVEIVGDVSSSGAATITGYGPKDCPKFAGTFKSRGSCTVNGDVSL